MSVTAASFDQSGNGHASGDSAGAMSHACRGHAELDAEREPSRRHAHASVEHGTPTPIGTQAKQEAEPRKQGIPRQEPGNEERLKAARSVLNEVADEDALRMRSQGMSYRQIGDRLGVTTAMAHRRVKRQVVR